MMSQRPGSDDDELIDELGAAVAEQESVPFRAAQAARGAFDLRTLDREIGLMDLLYDSLLDDRMLVRSVPDGGTRTLTFCGSDVYLEIEVIGNSVVGQVIPAQSAYVSLETTDGAAAAEQTDELGTFMLDGPPVGPVRLSCRTPEFKLRTDWFNY